MDNSLDAYKDSGTPIRQPLCSCLRPTSNYSFETTIVGTWTEHPDASKNFWSDNTYSILAINKQDHLNPSIGLIQKFVPLADRVLLSDIIVKIRNSSLIDSKTVGFRYKGGDFESKYLLLTVEPITCPLGNIIYWQGTVQDVTELKGVFSDIHSSIHLFIDYIEKNPNPIMMIDSHNLLSCWNRACELLTGYDADEMIGNRDALKILFRDNEQRLRLKNLLRETKGCVQGEFNIVTKSNTTRKILLSITQAGSLEDKNTAVVFAQDITSQTEELDKLNKLAGGLSLALSVATDLIDFPMEESCYHQLGLSLEKNFKNNLFIVNSIDTEQNFSVIEGIYGFASEEWQQVLEVLGWNPVGRRFQLSDESVELIRTVGTGSLGSSIYDVSSGVISSVSSRIIERMFAVNGIFSLRLSAGSNLFGWINVIACESEHGQSISAISDIINLFSLLFNRRKKEEQLLDAKIKAEEAERLKVAFMANLGHEIRTPMNAILGFTQLLNIPNLNKEKRRQYIEIINSKSRMLEKLINDMVDVGKVESGLLTLVKQPFDLNKLMRNLIAFYRNERVFQQREAVEFVLSIPNEADPFSFYCDEGRLEQVFTNLLDNALKFTERGTIEFGYSIASDRIEFFVKDSGIGIDEKMHKLIFDRFKQVDEKISRTREGKGLGLAISKGIIDLLGGEIGVESEPGKGARFIFSIPIEPPQDSSLVSEEFSQTENDLLPDWKNKILLIAEDEEINYMYISELLQPTGVNIIWAKDGVQAVDLVESIKNIDAVLMDIRMPNKNGYAASLEIRQLNPDIPIIAQTAFAYTEDRAKAQAAGCDEYITKPINSKELFAILERFLSR